MVIPTLSPHPAVYLTDRAGLAEYLRARGVDYNVQPLGFTINIDIGAIVDYLIDARWLDGQVRFLSPSGLNFPPARLAEVALTAEKVNMEIGFPVWRVTCNWQNLPAAAFARCSFIGGSSSFSVSLRGVATQRGAKRFPASATLAGESRGRYAVEARAERGAPLRRLR